jgi:hypothetical protein
VVGTTLAWYAHQLARDTAHIVAEALLRHLEPLLTDHGLAVRDERR